MKDLIYIRNLILIYLFQQWKLKVLRLTFTIHNLKKLNFIENLILRILMNLNELKCMKYFNIWYIKFINDKNVRSLMKPRRDFPLWTYSYSRTKK